MQTINKDNQSYFKLAKHNSYQFLLFIFLCVICSIVVFHILLPIAEDAFESFLSGRVMNAGEHVSYSLESAEPLKVTNYYLSWSVDIYLDTSQEARYWFNPLLSLSIISMLVGVILSILITTILPIPIGFIHQKIAREIVGFIDRIATIKYGYQAAYDTHKIAEDILNADLQELYGYVNELAISIEDLKVLQNAIKWQKSSLVYKLLHFNHGLQAYLRFSFTVKYSNAILGFVYIGAAILIIIIGLRGLKFVPPTQPSLVLFALGLEFTLLITYALTLMYTKQDEEPDKDNNNNQQSVNNTSELGNSKELEQLLRVFIKKTK